MRCDAGTWPQPWAAHKGHFRALKLRFEMRQRTFNKWQMLSAYASLCLRVFVCVCGGRTHCNCCRNIKAMRVFQLTSSVDCVKYAKNVL